MENPVTVALRLVNKTKSFNGYACVMMQKNKASHEEKGFPWRVFRNLEPGQAYAFEYLDQIQVAFSDNDGNLSPNYDAEPGSSFSVVKETSGLTLVQNRSSLDPTGIDIINEVEQGSFNLWCLRGGKKLAVEYNVDPNIDARFEFEPFELFLGVILSDEVDDTQDIDPAFLPYFKRIYLNGIASADIVIYGGGVGPSAEPFNFILENIIHLESNAVE